MSSPGHEFKAAYQEARHCCRFVGRRSGFGPVSFKSAEKRFSAGACAVLLSNAVLSSALLLPVVIVIVLLAEAGSF